MQLPKISNEYESPIFLELTVKIIWLSWVSFLKNLLNFSKLPLPFSLKLVACLYKLCPIEGRMVAIYLTDAYCRAMLNFFQTWKIVGEIPYLNVGFFLRDIPVSLQNFTSFFLASRYVFIVKNSSFLSYSYSLLSTV